MSKSWTCVSTLDALQPRDDKGPDALAREWQRKVVRIEGRQIALVNTPAGVVAFNNRCPHEGYPLGEGTFSVDGDTAECLLTCNWHNWKFRLPDGTNQYGGESLRTYPVEVRGDGEIWLDLADPPLEQRKSQLLAQLHAAFADNDYPRMAREMARLGHLGADPLDAVRAAILWSHDRFEFGWTHAYAGLDDWLRIHDSAADDDRLRLACLLEAVAHMADDSLRENTYAYAADVEAYDEEKFVGAIEAEDERLAIACLRGALGEEMTLESLEPALARSALAHYADFGHSAIYVSKVRRIVERLGPEVIEPLLLALVRQLVFATREDLIPEFRDYADTVEQLRFGTRDAPPPDDWHGLSITRALRVLGETVDADVQGLYASLLGANAWNLLCFDVRRTHDIEVTVDDNVSWLNVTHGLTFSLAVAELAGRYPHLWAAGLAQMACFAGRSARYTDPDIELQAWSVDDTEVFFDAAVAQVTDHEADEFIVSVHLLKTVMAGRDLAALPLPRPVVDRVVAGINRFTHSPVRRKQVLRTAHQALAFTAMDG